MKSNGQSFIMVWYNPGRWAESIRVPDQPLNRLASDVNRVIEESPQLARDTAIALLNPSSKNLKMLSDTAYNVVKKGGKKSNSKNMKRSKSGKPRGVITARRSGVEIVARQGRQRKSAKVTRRRTRRKKKSLRKRVSALEKNSTQYSNKISRVRTYGSALCEDNQVSYSTVPTWYPSHWEGLINDLKFYDVKHAGTNQIVSSDATDTGYLGDVNFANIYCRLRVKNAWDIPVRVTVYTLQYKDEMSDSAGTVLTNCDDPQGVTDVAINPCTFPQDFSYWNSKFKVLQTDKAVLQGGDEMVSSYSRKYMKYDPEIHDLESGPTYDRQSVVFFIRLEGMLAYDAVNDLRSGTPAIGQSSGGIVYQLDRNCSIRYPSTGVKLRYYDATANGGTLSNGAIAVGPNVVDLQE
jgi:hypothetical protein